MNFKIKVDDGKVTLLALLGCTTWWNLCVVWYDDTALSYLFTICLQKTRQQVEKTDDVCVAVSVDQELCRSSYQIPRTPPAVSHHRQVCHTQAHCFTGTTVYSFSWLGSRTVFKIRLTIIIDSYTSKNARNFNFFSC